MKKLLFALGQAEHLLRNVSDPWLLGGSCGLLLQGVPLQKTPRDLDLYADVSGAKEIHDRLSAYSIDEPVDDESGIYRSVLSHYDIHGIIVELVSGFEVIAFDSCYKVEAAFLHSYHAHELVLTDALSSGEQDSPAPVRLKVMPLEHELLFNILRDRPDRYTAIAEELRERKGGVTPAMRDLLARNAISGKVQQKVRDLLLRG
ncbi:nucleotidyltransferase domain-containing protein [Paenibacillus xerothermodurans]|nr:hypothetical protein [Paenibacillus xerothermodurans]